MPHPMTAKHSGDTHSISITCKYRQCCTILVWTVQHCCASRLSLTSTLPVLASTPVAWSPDTLRLFARDEGAGVFCAAVECTPPAESSPPPLSCLLLSSLVLPFPPSEQHRVPTRGDRLFCGDNEQKPTMCNHSWIIVMHAWGLACIALRVLWTK